MKEEKQKTEGKRDREREEGGGVLYCMWKLKLYSKWRGLSYRLT
jgi:hypothetical protein